MEYVAGVSLTHYMRQSWTWPKLWHVIDCLLSGLAHAHARDLVHRDLKPGNVLVIPHADDAGSIKLADFGIALAVHEAASANRRIEGTPAYIAPEAASGDVAATGPWTDLYSLGVMLFELLTGERPFYGRNLLAHHQRTPAPPIRIRADVEAPTGLIPIVERLLAKAPYERFRSVAGVRAALGALGPKPTPQALGAPPQLALLDAEPTTADPADLHPAHGPSGPGLIHLREPQIAGRESARRVLTNAADAALAGRGPRVVLIEGDAGLGKSRLAGWLRERLEESGRMRSLLIKSEPQTRSGGGLRQGVLRFFGAPTLTQAEATRVFEHVFRDPEARTNAIEALWSNAPHQGPGSEGHLARAARLIADLGSGLPLMIMADDAQWSPEGKVLRLIHRLARDPKHRHLLIVVTLRVSQRSTVLAARGALLRLDNVESLPLSPISPEALAPALDALAPLPAGLALQASRQSRGNPLIALEAVRSHLEQEGVSTAPSDPAAVLRSRIETATRGPSGGELRSALARATLLGRSFTLEPLAVLCAVDGDSDAPDLPSSPEALEALLERAVDAGLAVEQGPRRWRFSHDLVRGQLRQICQRLTNWPQINLASARLKAQRAEADSTGIELEVVARHHAEGGEMGHALRMGLRSVKRLHASGLMGHATSFSRRLLEWDDVCQILSAEERGDLRILCSDAAEHAGQPDEAERQARTALELAERNYLPALASRAASRLGALYVYYDDLDEAEDWLVRALRFARRSGDRRARCAAHQSLGQFYERLERLDSALAAYQASLESARAANCHAEALAVRTAIARIDRTEGRIEHAEDTLRRVIDDATERGLEVQALHARLQLALCAWTRDDAVTARPLFSEVRQGARGNLFALELFASLGEAWAAAVDEAWPTVEMLLLQAEDLRYDVHLYVNEAEQLHRVLRQLAIRARRPDIAARMDRLDAVVTRTQSTTRAVETTDSSPTVS